MVAGRNGDLGAALTLPAARAARFGFVRHGVRTAILAAALARRLGLDAGTVRRLRLAALLHDIGKVGVPGAVLRKPGPLTDEEWAAVRRHPEVGAEIVARVPGLTPVAEIILAHHERWDGSGYPRGLKGEEIPVEARILAVADVYDALRSDRPYRPAWSEEEALSYIRAQSGRLFDPRVVEALEEVTA